MGHFNRLLTLSAWLLVSGVLAVQSADAQNRYPSIDDAWDATDYRAMVQRIENDGLALPTLAGGSTKPVFERMVNSDNIPLRMGQNKELSITIRFQRLEPLLQPLHQIIDFYASEAQKGKPYATELARLKVYESKAAGVLLDILDPFLSSLPKDKRYPAIAAELNKSKDVARVIYSDLVNSMGETSLYSKTDILGMVDGATNALRSYQPVLTDQDRADLNKALAKQISTTSDQELKTALTELRDAIEHRRIRT